MTTGAVALLQTLVRCGVEVCFMNPGTSEMHFVAALDDVPALRSVLTLFEGVASGAADGYARMAGRPAVTLLHLGPGLGNAVANLHNARRAGSPMLTVVGAHATYHERYDAPLQSDIATVARTLSSWVHTTGLTRDLGRDAAEAVAAAHRGGATLILPADVSWGDGGVVANPWPVPGRRPADPEAVTRAEQAVRGAALLLLGGDALGARGQRAASRICAATGCRALAETFPARMARGAGLPPLDRLAYLGESAAGQLEGVETVILAGARAPVTFFAYPDRPSDLAPDSVVELAVGGDDATAALEALADLVAPGVQPAVQDRAVADDPIGDLDVQTFAAAIGAALPDDAILVDESTTSGFLLPSATAGAAPHDLLTLTGGAIGFGMPAALGAAIAAPDRPVVTLQSDGAAMYTVQALWSQAREQTNTTTVLINNGAYAILRMELSRVGADGGGPRAADMLDLRRPDLDFTALARGQGVPAERVTTAQELTAALRRATREPGPALIEAMVAPII